MPTPPTSPGPADDFGPLLHGVLTAFDGSVRYALHGELDMSNVERLAGRLAEVLEAHGPRVQLDLVELRFIDSSGLRALVRAGQAAEARGGSLRLVRPSPAVVQVLGLAGFEDVLRVRGGPSWGDLRF